MDSKADFERFRAMVVSEPVLRERLLECRSDAELFSLVIALARDRGLIFDETDLSRIANQNRRRWLERWTLA
ncbi:MAG TPA: Nif11-like leader peptide family natural product precursor [Bryobacteraceae bacterium]|nr:Nif11-like leader peptide family natural product precursor [Bryobacteraceae bacterium]